MNTLENFGPFTDLVPFVDTLNSWLVANSNREVSVVATITYQSDTYSLAINRGIVVVRALENTAVKAVFQRERAGLFNSVCQFSYDSAQVFFDERLIVTVGTVAIGSTEIVSTPDCLNRIYWERFSKLDKLVWDTRSGILTPDPMRVKEEL